MLWYNPFPHWSIVLASVHLTLAISVLVWIVGGVTMWMLSSRLSRVMVISLSAFTIVLNAHAYWLGKTAVFPKACWLKTHCGMERPMVAEVPIRRHQQWLCRVPIEFGWYPLCIWTVYPSGLNLNIVGFGSTFVPVESVDFILHRDIYTNPPREPSYALEHHSPNLRNGKIILSHEAFYGLEGVLPEAKVSFPL